MNGSMGNRDARASREEKSGRERSRRPPPEEAPRQPAAVIEDDFHRSLLRHWPSIWNHSNHAFL
jgi:hypothetical protein